MMEIAQLFSLFAATADGAGSRSSRRMSRGSYTLRARSLRGRHRAAALPRLARTRQDGTSSTIVTACVTRFVCRFSVCAEISQHRAPDLLAFHGENLQDTRFTIIAGAKWRSSSCTIFHIGPFMVGIAVRSSRLSRPELGARRGSRASQRRSAGDSSSASGSSASVAGGVGERCGSSLSRSSSGSIASSTTGRRRPRSPRLRACSLSRACGEGLSTDSSSSPRRDLFVVRMCLLASASVRDAGRSPVSPGCRR